MKQWLFGVIALTPLCASAHHGGSHESWLGLAFIMTGVLLATIAARFDGGRGQVQSIEDNAQVVRSEPSMQRGVGHV
ncbi:MAG: hypothetical protein AAF541_10075 [Pseudomonadota bacterium]